MNSSGQNHKKQAKKAEASWPLAIAALICVMGISFIYSAMKPAEVQSPAPVVDLAQLEERHNERVAQYKRELGEKLNRERVVTQHKLTLGSAGMPNDEIGATVRPSAIDGLPLSYEKPTYAEREPSRKIDETMAEHDVALELQDDQQAQYWEEEARKLFLKQYVLNARAKGYDVAIDKEYNVVVRGVPTQSGRTPQNFEALKPFRTLRYSAPFFVPPFCAR